MVRAEIDRTLKRWGPTLMTALVLAGLLTLTGAARRAAAHSERFRVRPEVSEVVSAPDWLAATAATVLARQLGLGLQPASLQDPDGLAGWRAQLDRLSPWVAAVDDVEASFPGRAEVRLRLRRPVLVMPTDELVAADGVVLGRAPVQLDPAPLLVPQALAGAALAECAAVAAEIGPHRPLLARQEIRLASVGLGADGRVVLVTDDGVQLEWGRSLEHSAFAPVDLPAADRVAHLLEVAERHPGLIGVERVRLWLDRPEVILRRRG